MRASIPPLLALLLAGCATSALRLAPSAPDRPWSSAVDASGGLTADPDKGHAVHPEGYVLPANPAAALMPAAPAIDTAKIYELADLIDLAERTNPETRIAWNDARNAALAAGIARSAHLPRLTATALGGYETHSGHSSALGLSANEGGSLTGTISTLSLEWLLFDFGRREALVKAADAGVRAAKAEFMPNVFVSASGSYTSGDIDVTALPGVGDQSPTVNLSNHRFGTTVLGGVTIPLYDAGVRDAMLAQAPDRAASAAQVLNRAKLGASQEVVMANSKLRTSLAAVAATKALLDASQTTYNAALAAFRHGIGSSTDMLAAERQLLEARNAAADAHSATLSAAATLALACGELGKAPQ